MRYLPLLAGLLACGPALAQSVPPVTAAPTVAGQVANKGYVDAAVAAAVAAAGNAASLTSGTISAARLPVGTAAGTVAAGNDARIVGAAQSSALAAVATSGSYADLSGKPVIPAAPPQASTTAAGVVKLGDGLIPCAADATKVCVDSQAPVASSAAPLASTAFVDATGHSFTGQQLAALVASINGSGGSSSSSGTLPASSPTPTPTAFPLTFAGAAGPLTGAQVLTPMSGSDVTGAALDGHGDLARPIANYSFGFFAAAGVIPDGTAVDYTFDGGGTGGLTPNQRKIGIPFRVTSDGATGYQLVILADDVYLQKLVAGTQTQISHVGPVTPSLYGATSLGVRFSGSTITLRANGSDTAATFTDSSITAAGYVGFGSADVPLAVSQISLH